jgi:hypothetical protein
LSGQTSSQKYRDNDRTHQSFTRASTEASTQAIISTRAAAGSLLYWALTSLLPPTPPV